MVLQYLIIHFKNLLTFIHNSSILQIIVIIERIPMIPCVNDVRQMKYSDDPVIQIILLMYSSMIKAYLTGLVLPSTLNISVLCEINVKE